ncbi:MAG TPA: hypothetical protein VEZ11_15560, partial [Thermoanaerobaculia bacterium]|nr:hypothetical protein [Thermoanaerobaculia bacterium]
MRRAIPFLVAGGLAAVLFGSTLTAGDHGRHGSDHAFIESRHGISVNNEGDAVDCGSFDVSIAGVKAARAEETVPAAGLRSLRVHSDRHGGVHVIGWDQSQYAITACKAAASTAGLAAIQPSLSGNDLTVKGPDSEDWMTIFIIHTPNNATLDIDTTNGPISFRDVVGTVTANAVNGPIALKGSSGTIDATTKNGPISIADGSGTVKLHAHNGPVSVKLASTSWNGSLDAQTDNGPVSLKIPHGYQSGVLVESSGRGP